MKKKKVIFSLSWRDIKSPGMGGAEIVTHQMLKRCVKEGMKVIHFAPLAAGMPYREIIDGVVYLRKGNTATVIFEAIKFYYKNKKKIDIVIDECNTFRFFTPLWVEKKKRVFLIYQLTREIWWINAKFPLNVMGWLSETPLLLLNRNDITITESLSTKNDLIKVGYKKEKVHIIPVGIPDEIRNIPLQEKVDNKIFVYVGRYSNYKGINKCVEALGIVKRQYCDAKLWIVGKKDEVYIDEILKPICRKYELSIGENESNDIVTWGFVTEEKKFELQRKAKALIFPSKREGWGMIVSEAGALGTPSITYNAPGMIDAIDFGNAGYLCKENSVRGIVHCMRQVIIDKKQYNIYRKKAWEYSNKLNFETTGKMFYELIDNIH